MSLARPLAWTVCQQTADLAVAGQKTKPIQLGTMVSGVNEVPVLSNIVPGTFAGGTSLWYEDFFQRHSSLIPDWGLL